MNANVEEQVTKHHQTGALCCFLSFPCDLRSCTVNQMNNNSPTAEHVLNELLPLALKAQSQWGYVPENFG
jgi:hypothetical protein